MLERDNTFQRFNVLYERGKAFPLFYYKMDQKSIKNANNAELIINYAEEIIDLATELQYLIIEEKGVLEDKQSNSSKEMPEMWARRSGEERTQNTTKKENTDVEVQKLYVPVFRLSAKNKSTDKST